MITTGRSDRIRRSLRRKESDLAAILRLREKWRTAAMRFPHIYDGFRQEGENILRDIATLRELKLRHGTAAAAPTPTAPTPETVGLRLEGVSLPDPEVDDEERSQEMYILEDLATIGRDAQRN
ncbi:MAG: hypothetical protein HY722_07030 [Planctomycetes bacterium]|nr:hypothetical protein [Planctomycetota bacterium]